MIVYKRRMRRKVYERGIFDTIGKLVGKAASSAAAKKLVEVASSEAVKKAASEASKKVATKVGSLAGDKIVQGIDKLAKRKPKVTQQLTPESAQMLQALAAPKSIGNILEGKGQAIAIDKLARRLNRL